MRRIALIISLAVAGALQAQVDEEWPGIDETPALQSFLTGLMEDDPETYDTLTEACVGDVSKAFVQVRDVVGDSGESAEAQRQILQEAAVYLRHRAGNGGDMADTTAASSTTTWDHLYNSIIDELDDLNDRYLAIDRNLDAKVQQYHALGDAAAREAAVAGLREAVHSAFDERLDAQKKHFERIARIISNEARRKHQQTQDQVKDRVCEKRLKYLLTDPRLRW
jgi:hypothetical protein